MSSSTTKYLKLFSIRCSHEYYRDGICRDFDLLPTDECRELLRQYGLKFRKMTDGAAIYFAAFSNGTPKRPVTDIPNDTRFSFAMVLKNPDLHRFSTLGTPLNKPSYQVKNHLFYFDSNDSVAGPIAQTQSYDMLPAGAPQMDGLSADTLQVSGNVKTVMAASPGLLFSDMQGILGDNNDAFAALRDQGDYLEVELMDTVPPGTSIRTSMRKEKNNHPQKKVMLEGSADRLSWTKIGNSITVSHSVNNNNLSASYRDKSKTLNGGDFPKGVRFIRYTKEDNHDGEPLLLGHVDYDFSVVDTNETHHLPQSMRSSGPLINFDIADGGQPTGILSITGPDPGLPNPLIQRTLLAEEGRFRTQIDLSRHPKGKYSLHFDAGGTITELVYYVDANLAFGNYFGVIEIRNNPGTVWDHVPESSLMPDEVIYNISFTPRKTVWRYFVIHKSNTGSPGDFLIRDDENPNAGRYPKLVFADRTNDFLGPDSNFQGFPARVWVSVFDNPPGALKPIRFMEEANPDINLYKNNGGLELVRNHLPNPRLESIAKDDDYDTFTFSDVFIYT